jgi:hypothetical protein
MVVILVAMPNPWHDEIGRFAPKGTGTKSGGDIVAKSESQPGSLRRKIEDEIDIFLRGRPRLRDSDIELLKDSIGALMPPGEDDPPWSDVRRREGGDIVAKNTSVAPDGGGPSPLPWLNPLPKGGAASRPLVKSSQVDDFYGEVNRVLKESLDGVHDIKPPLRDRVKRKLHELVDKFMEGLDEDLGDKNWDPIGLVPYTERRRWDEWQ